MCLPAWKPINRKKLPAYGRYILGNTWAMRSERLRF
jgi:hypothetical protein